MLIQFSVENYLSFKNRVNFSFKSSSIKELPNNLNQFQDGRLELINGAVVYGSNGGGKSNLIQAISFMKEFVIDSFRSKQANEKIEVQPFKLSTETLLKPSRFEIEILIGEKRYRYYFQVDKYKVLEECLYTSKIKKESLVFERKFDSESQSYDYHFDNDFKKSDIADQTIVRDNALLLSVSSQFNGEISKLIVDWFQNALFVSGTNYLEFIDYTANLLSDSKHSKAIRRLLREANLGFTDVSVEKKEITEEMLVGLPADMKKLMLSMNKEVMTVKTKHTKREKNGRPLDEVSFDLMTEESLGSQKFFALTGPIYKSLLSGSLLVIDELDARLHPHLCSLIIDFYIAEQNNPNKAQFIFTTHNTQFLSKDLLRRDQLILVDKTEEEYSNIYTMAEHDSKVRNDASYENAYKAGVLGAVPFKQNKGKQINIWDSQTN